MAYIHSYNCVTPLGITVQENVEALLQGKTGIQFYPHYESFSDIYLGKIPSQMIEDAFPYVSPSMELSWLERLTLLAVIPFVPIIFTRERTAFVFATTKGNISKLNTSSDGDTLPYLTKIAKKIATFIGIKTEPIVVSNACVSGAMAVSVADRLIRMGSYDNALVVAADEVSEFVLSGF